MKSSGLRDTRPPNITFHFKRRKTASKKYRTTLALPAQSLQRKSRARFSRPSFFSYRSAPFDKMPSNNAINLCSKVIVVFAPKRVLIAGDSSFVASSRVSTPLISGGHVEGSMKWKASRMVNVERGDDTSRALNAARKDAISEYPKLRVGAAFRVG